MISNFTPLSKTVKIQIPGHTLQLGNTSDWILFAGPDILEDEGLVLEVGAEIKKITQQLGIPWVLKCSFDKANRQSLESFRGPGWQEALKILNKIKTKLDVAILTDVHETHQVLAVSEVADVIQIPALLCRQTDLVVAAAKTGKPLHIKKGQFIAPTDMKAIAEKAELVGNDKILLCERGTFFGYHRLVNDMTGLVEMRSLGYPVVMDASHSVQLPGMGGGKSSGRREMIPALARAAMAVGVDGLFLEVHPEPDSALCDGPNSLRLDTLENLLKHLQSIFKTHKL